MKIAPSATSKGTNFLAIACAKAAEMADTLENSGTANRPPMIGEFGWRGGLIARVKPAARLWPSAARCRPMTTSQSPKPALKC